MLIYNDDGTIVTIPDIERIINKMSSPRKREKFTIKLEEWKRQYNSLGCGWTFSGNWVAVKTT